MLRRSWQSGNCKSRNTRNGTEQAEQTEKLNIVSYLVMLLWRQLFSATIGSHMRP